MSETTEKSPDIINSMFKVGAHFGYSKSRRHPSMSSYIFGAKNKVEIFDLEKTSDLLSSMKEFMKQCGVDRKMVLFVGGKNEARDTIKDAALSIGMPYVAGRWIGGTLTNFPEIKKRIDRLEDLSEKRESGELAKYTKLEQLHIDREIEDLNSTFGGLRVMKKIPHAIFVVDSKRENIAVAEAKKMGLKIAGLLSSDCDTHEVDHFVLGNDSSIMSIQFFVNELAAAYKEGLAVTPPPPKEIEKGEVKNKEKDTA